MVEDDPGSAQQYKYQFAHYGSRITDPFYHQFSSKVEEFKWQKIYLTSAYWNNNGEHRY